MTTIVNYECDSAVAALVIAGIDKQQAAEMVAALHPVLPEATAEDLTQIVLSSATLAELRKVNLQFRVPDELKSLIPQVAPLLGSLRKNTKLKSWLGLR
jgi:hypothetical protein